MNWEQIDFWAHDFQTALAQGDATGEARDNLCDENLQEFEQGYG